MSEAQEIERLFSFPLHLPPPLASPYVQAVPCNEPPSPTTCLSPPLRPSPGPRTFSAPANPFMVSEAIQRIYLRDRAKRLEFSRASSYSPLNTGSPILSSIRHDSASIISLHSGASSSTSLAVSSHRSAISSHRSSRHSWPLELVPLPESVCASISEPQTAYDDLGLPHNGSEVPFLWSVEEFSRWDTDFRRIVGPLRAMLDSANLLLAQSGIALAGMHGSCVPEHMRVVLTILLDEQDVDKVLGVGEIQDAIEALVQQAFRETPAPPPVRYWVKEERKMELERELLCGVQTFGGREPMLRKTLKLRQEYAAEEGSLQSGRKYDQFWRKEAAWKLALERERKAYEKAVADKERLEKFNRAREAAAEKKEKRLAASESTDGPSGRMASAGKGLMKALRLSKKT